MIKIDFSVKSEIVPEYIVDSSGRKYLFDELGQPHSYNDMPAIIYAYGTKEWFKHGLRHRDNNLPAVIFENGLKHWYVNGDFIRTEYP